MVDLDKAKEFIVTAAKGVSQTSIQTAVKNIGGLESFDLSSFSIPIVSSDPNVNKIVEELGLRNPENLIKLFVEAHFAQFDCIHLQFSDLKNLDMGNFTSQVRAAKKKIIRGMDNPSDKKHWLNEAANQLYDVIDALEDKVLNIYIPGIRKIDNTRNNRLLGFVRSKFDLSMVDDNNHCAKAAVDAITEAVNLQILISAELGDKIERSVLKPFDNFKSKLLSGDNCKLMHDYDDDSETEFWLKLPDKIDHAFETAALLESTLETDDGLDYDNIEFN